VPTIGTGWVTVKAVSPFSYLYDLAKSPMKWA
jgi:hypothetical protein